jgi:large subunit ribosomal protein L21
MQAIIAESGKQFHVKAGDVLQLDFQQLEPGTVMTFERVLMVSDGNGKVAVGAPFLPNAKVVAKVRNIVRGPKIHVGWYTRRKNFRKHKGHRQSFLEVAIESVSYSK